MQNYRPEIDGLRAIAVVPVIFFHAGFESFSGGFVGVDVFFVISGYLITSIIHGEIQSGKFSITGFYERRARRILPALFFVCLTCIPFAWVLMTPDQLTDFAQSLIAVILFSSNVLFWQEAGYFAPAAELKPLLHTWSLAVEEQFYVLFPLLLLLLSRAASRTVLSIIVFITLGSLALSEWASHTYPTAGFFLLPTRAWELGAGAILALTNKDIWRPQLLVGQLGSALGLFLILYAVFVFDENVPFPGLWALVPTLGTVLLILYAQPQTIIGTILGRPLIVGVGLISYSAYLWHQPIFAFSRLRLIDEPAKSTYLYLIALTFCLAYLSWRFVERPFREQRDKIIYSRSGILTSGILITYVLVGFVVFVHVEGSFPKEASAAARPAPEFFEILSDERIDDVRYGYCQYDAGLATTGIKPFLENWKCFGDSDQLVNSNIAIFGDSIAGDKAAAIRMNGFDVMQLGGSYCPLAPSLMNKTCAQLADAFMQAIQQHPVENIWLAASFSTNELASSKIDELIEYWSATGIAVTIFSPMPVYNQFSSQFFANIESGRRFSPDLTSHERFFSPGIRDKFAKAGFTVVNTRAIFCSLTPECDPVADGSPLLIDQHHLSRLGAAKFGAALLANTNLSLQR
jgi:peptidoglycan/LPS O-acetylase OafA/YrhL